MSYYTRYKDLFNSVKPIRGRAEDVRPIGQRRRDWETIRMNGDVVECVLYKTPVVRYYPDGKIGFLCGGWATPSTAEFMHIHSPLMARKKDNRIWVQETRESTAVYPLPESGETVFVLTADNKWVPENPITVNKLVIDKQKARDARAPFMPFIKFAEAFLKMSDGWLMADTVAQFGTVDYECSWHRAVYKFGDGLGSLPGYGMRRSQATQETRLLDFIQDAPEEGYMRALCMVCLMMEPLSTRLSRTELIQPDPGSSFLSPREIKFYDRKYDPKALRGKVYRMPRSGAPPATP